MQTVPVSIKPEDIAVLKEGWIDAIDKDWILPMSLCKGHDQEMNSDTHNNVGHKSSTSLLDEADELSRNRKWTRSFALYIMFCQAMSVRDKLSAEACMNLLEKEGENSLVDPVFGKPQKDYDKSGETK